jgi:hypothetical protein
MANTKDLVLVYPTMDRLDLKESVNIMLSPQFYTLKKEILPIKYAHQAKKIAPSLFEGLLDGDGNYEYAVFREEEEWVFVAYDGEEIKVFLRSKGIKEEQVEKVYFAQEALGSFTHPMSLGENESLVVLENTVVVVPLMALEDRKPTLSFGNTFTPKSGGVTFKSKSVSVVEEKESWMIAAVFALFAGMFLIEGLRSGGDDEAVKEEMQVILEEYPALESTYTRLPELKKYRALDKDEREKRETIKSFSSFIFKGVVLTAMNVNEKGFYGQFECADATVVKKVQALAKKKNYIITLKGKNILEIKGAL